MRIISGKYRAKTIIAPRNLPVRPTTDFAKEALFNILNNYYDLSAIRVLDLFGGTGNISYEFCSRGCTSLLAVDQSPKCVAFINKTLGDLKFEGARAVVSEVQKFTSKNGAGLYDVVFADPPYDYDNYNAIIQNILVNNWLTDEGMLIVEHNNTQNFEEHPNFVQEKKYGNVHFSFFELETEEE